MGNLKEVLEEWFNEISRKNDDLSDLGNEIGQIVGKYLKDELGFSKKDFIAGFDHGLSLVDETHNN